MNNASQQNITSLLIAFKTVRGIAFSMVILCFGYIFSHHAVAATVQTPQQSLWQPLDTHAHVVIYRVDEESLPAAKGVLNIFVDNQYHTSVLPRNRAVELVLCPGKKSLDISIGQLDKHRFGQPDKLSVTSPTLQSGVRYFYQVSLDPEGKISARWVPEKEAQAALINLKPQMLTLSRVTDEHYCPEVIYSIDTRKLFTQQKNSTTLSQEGNRALSALVKTVDSEFRQVDKIIVKNASDSDEQTRVTHPLSQRRANSVATWLVNSAFPSQQFIAQGKDIKNCAASPADQACAETKRSVDVEVYGVLKSRRAPL